MAWFGWVRLGLLVLAFLLPTIFWSGSFLQDPQIVDVEIDESIKVALQDKNSALQFADPENPNSGISVKYPDFSVNFIQLRVDANPGTTIEFQDSRSHRSGTLVSEQTITLHEYRETPDLTEPLPNQITISTTPDNIIRRVEVIFGQRIGDLYRIQTSFGLTLFLSVFLPFLILTILKIQKREHVGFNSYVLIASLIIFFGFAIRLMENDRMHYRPLGYDAAGYVEIAQLGGGLYETAMSKAPWVREPLWPWVLRGWFLVFPETNSSAMVCSICVSVAGMIVSAIVGWRVFGFFPGLVGVAALAFTPEWIGMSVRVLRHDLVLLLILAGLGLKTWKSLDRWKYGRGCVWGLWASLMMLTQFSFLLFIGPMLLWEALRTRWRPVEYALAAGFLVLLITPHLIFNMRFQNSGDPLFSSSIHTLYYYNKENLGKPGFPTAAEFRVNPYVGERMSTAAFFFKHHSFLEVVKLHLKGYWNLFVWVQPRIYLFRGIEWLMLPGLLGGIEMVRRGKLWVALVFAFAVLPLAFIAGLGADLRLGMEATIFVAWVWGLGLVLCYNNVHKRPLPSTTVH